MDVGGPPTVLGDMIPITRALRAELKVIVPQTLVSSRIISCLGSFRPFLLMSVCVTRSVPMAEQHPTSNPKKCSAPEAALQSPFTDHLADDAMVWTLYLEATTPKGEELTRVWNSDLDTILIFVRP